MAKKLYGLEMEYQEEVERFLGTKSKSLLERMEYLEDDYINSDYSFSVVVNNRKKSG